MKRNLFALAALCALAGAAAAQSSVTLFGIVDVNLRRVTNGDNSQTRVDNDGLASSRFGVRGVEDLGGGLKAGFELQSRVNADVGGTDTAKFWGRRAVVYLNGPWGELRLGRDYVASFWNIDNFDPFATNGLGSSLNVVGKALGSGATTFLRSDNLVQYFLPPGLGGVYGQAGVSAGEGVPGNKVAAARIGYASGPLNVSVSAAQTDVAASATGATKYKVTNFGVSYDFGVVKLMGELVSEKYAPKEQKSWEIGATAPLGQGTLRVSYWHADNQGGGTDANDSRHFAIGYVYDLSKRTAIYTTYGHLSNNGAAALSVGAGPLLPPGRASSGYDLGLRHTF